MNFSLEIDINEGVTSQELADTLQDLVDCIRENLYVETTRQYGHKVARAIIDANGNVGSWKLEDNFSNKSGAI